MSAIIIQIFFIILLIIVMKDIIKLERYPKWAIPIYIITIFCEYSNFNSTFPSYSIIGFLNSISLMLLGAIGYLLLRYF